MKKLTAFTAALVMILCLAGTAAAAGKTITPLYPSTDIYHLEDRFVTTDIELSEENSDMAVFTLYERERFAAAAIRNVAIGDVIVTDGFTVAFLGCDICAWSEYNVLQISV